MEVSVFGISVAHIVFTIISSFLTAFIAVQLALNKFKKEKLWERKLEAYENIIESLHKIRKSYDRDIIAEYENIEYSQEELNAQYQEYKFALDEVDKFTDIGSLITSKESINILNQYKKNKFDSKLEARKNHYDGYMVLSHELYNAECCLKDIIKSAKKDLNNNSLKKLLNKLHIKEPT